MTDLILAFYPRFGLGLLGLVLLGAGVLVMTRGFLPLGLLFLAGGAAALAGLALWVRKEADMSPLADIVSQWSLRQNPPAAGTARYGIVDTTFAVAMQGPRAIDQLRSHGVADERIVWRTVPGFKDLGAAARRMLEPAAAGGDGCDIVIACGMAGPEEIDKQCAQDASIGLQMCQQATGKPVLEVIVHMDEAEGDGLVAVVDNRVREHATNAFWIMEAPGELTRRTGTGQRQGFEDVGGLDASLND